MLFPDRVTHKREGKTTNSDGLEVAGAPSTIERGIKALIIRPGAGIQATAFGQAEFDSDVILLDPRDEGGRLRNVRHRDMFVDEETAEVWIATSPGDPMRNPTYFPTVGTKYSHIEVRVVRGDIESATVHDEEYYP